MDYEWEGWMWVGEIPDELGKFVPARVEWIEVDADSHDRFFDENDSDDKAIESKDSVDLRSRCHLAPCMPSAYLEMLKTNAPFRFVE